MVKHLTRELDLIPISEKLPVMGEWIILRGWNVSGKLVSTFGCYRESGSFMDVYGHEMQKVSHWAARPRP